MDATKRPWATIPELPNDVYQVLPNGYGYLGEFCDGENVSGAANAALVIRAVNTFDQAREALKSTLAALVAAISLLERGGKAAKKAAPSDKMFNQMMRDYKNAVVNARKALAAMEETP